VSSNHACILGKSVSAVSSRERVPFGSSDSIVSLRDLVESTAGNADFEGSGIGCGRRVEGFYKRRGDCSEKEALEDMP
jgi:hypothetical protein